VGLQVASIPPQASRSFAAITRLYRKLQDIFTNAFANEEKRLNNLILAIPGYIKEQLSSIINCDEGISQINIIRSDQKDFQYIAVKIEVEKAQSIAELYEFSKLFIPSLELSKNAVRYYADVTEQYAAFRLRKLNKATLIFRPLWV
jgi:hypothetical protein